MHFHHIVEPAHKGRRGVRLFLNFELPLNPICWAIGHKAKVTVVESKYSPSWRLVECRVCGRRYQGGGIDKSILDSLGKTYADHQAGQVAYARTNPREVARSCSGRADYAERKVETHLELWVRRPSRAAFEHLGFRFHVGTKSSETPWDGHLELGVVSAYWGIGGAGERLAQWLGRGHKRDIALRVHGGSLWWSLWHDDDGGNDSYHRCDKRRPAWWSSKDKYRGWRCLRDGNIDLNPASVLWGTPKYHYEDVGEVRHGWVDVGQFDGDRYLVDFQLRRQRHHRDDGPRWAQRVLSEEWTYDAKCHPGIPVRNHDWKGDEILGWGGGLTGWVSATSGAFVSDWLPLAVANTKALVERDRRRYDYRPRKADA